jgi:signal transduction histidine kinase
MQKRAGGQQFNPDTIKDADLRAYLQHLTASLNKQNQELKIQSLKNKIFERFTQAKTTQQMIQFIAEDLRLPGSSLRIVVIEEHSLGKKETLTAECGEFAHDYAYLDDQIIQQLGDKTQINIPDTTKIHSIKFSPDKRFPKTIAAFHFLQSPESNGYLWMTYEVIKEFSAFELDLLSQVLGTLAQVCEHSQKLSDLSTRSGIFERALEMADFPVLVINNQGEIRYVNSFMNKWTDEQIDKIRGNQGIAKWLDSKKPEINIDIEINHRDYQLSGRKVTEEEFKDIAILFLLDESDFVRKQTYLKLAIDTINHDFKSALINLQGFSKLLGMVGEMNPKQSEYLKMISDGVEDISTIVNDLFEVSRLEREGGLRLTANQPAEILNRAVTLVQAEARQKRVEIAVNTGTTETIAIDQVFILVALHTLLTNAVRNSHIGGIVYFDEKCVDGEWIISVSDEGKGISQVDIERLEETHFQAAEWPGLSLVNRIAHFHKGKLKVESELGKGSKFCIHIPCKK